MHMLKAANNYSHRTGSNADGAANAPSLINDSDRSWALLAVRRVQRLIRLAGEICQEPNACITPWWALIDRSLALRDGLRIGPAGRVAATRALRLRQHCINGVG